jgi:vacuolar-type H+-ATPase subunit E/Vma4
MSKIKQGLASIANEVLEDVRKEAEALLLSAEKEAKENLKTAKAEADQTYEGILTEAAAKTETEKRKIASRTQVDLRNRLLQAKAELVDAAFNKALTRLSAFAQTENYRRLLVKLIQEAATSLQSKNLTLYVNAKDKAWLTVGKLNGLSKKFNVELKLAEQTEDFIGGCRVRTADGKVFYDNTLENRLQQLKPTLRLEVATTLFGKER